MDPEEQVISFFEKETLPVEPIDLNLLREWNDNLRRYVNLVGMRVYNPIPIIYIEP
jgi:hypothetical protein